ncbi:HAD family hydrolase [Paenibacillus paridis]|uniref:HAD family hydrolase n=1 Tax=Paenibacillus paridis TaxID=2583376 RepID=UPI001EE43A8A|nr:HAD family hydrolase [Paenibacillus paridis]
MVISEILLPKSKRATDQCASVCIFRKGGLRLYQTYIFDLYGTLIDIQTDEESQQLWENMALYFRYNGMNVSGQALQALTLCHMEQHLEAGRRRCEYPDYVIEDVFADVVRKLKGRANTAWLQETVRWFRILSMRKLMLYEGAIEVLTGLRHRGKKIYLLSNGQKTFIEMELKSLGIDHCFDGIAISSVAGISKPDPLFYAYLCGKYQVNLSAALMIGNDPRTDMEGARRAGIDGCYLRTSASPAHLLETRSKWLIEDGDLRKIPGWQ